MKNARSLSFDFPGLRIGCAEYAEGPTGTTMFHFPSRVWAAVDCRGGSPATSLTDLIRANYAPFVSAIVFSGGSAFGLEAASGVVSRLLSSGVAYAKWDGIAIVPSAVVYDFRGRTNSIFPDRELGMAAFDSARDGFFPLGAHGAGAFVHCGKVAGEDYMERAGQGGAFGQFGSTKIAVFTVVNAIGCLVDRAGTVVLGNRDPATGLRRPAAELRKWDESRNGTVPAHSGELTGNTTLTLVITNREMNETQLQRLAVQTHVSMARAIQPFHASRDGDTLFAVTTREDHSSDPSLDDLCLYASEIAWDAVLSCADRSPA